MSNLRQIWTAMQLYRDQWEGRDRGTAAEMGMPPTAGAFLSPSQFRDLTGNCRGKGVRPNRPGGYAFQWPQKVYPDFDAYMEAQWAQFVEATEGDPVFAADYSHQDSYPVSRYSLNRGIGISLSGSIRIRSNYGDPELLSWWYVDN